LQWAGNRILARDGRDLWTVMDEAGGNRAAFGDDNDPHINVEVCSDGEHVLFDTTRNGNLELWSSRADGSNAVKLADEQMAEASTCSGDSKFAEYVNGNRWWRVPVGGGPSEKIELPFAQVGYSRDGTKMFYFSQSVENGTYHGKLVVENAGNNAVLQALEAPYGMSQPVFTPDGKAIAYMLTRDRATNIWLQPESGGAAQQLTKFTGERMFAFAWSADGKKLAFSRGERKTDVVMMSGFR